MVNGQWLMRNQELLTLDEKELMKEAQVYAEKIDAFLIEREQSVLSKLVAIGGAMQQESFEVQAKFRSKTHRLSFVHWIKRGYQYCLHSPLPRI